MPRCSLSMSISLTSKSLTRSSSAATAATGSQSTLSSAQQHACVRSLAHHSHGLLAISLVLRAPQRLGWEYIAILGTRALTDSAARSPLQVLAAVESAAASLQAGVDAAAHSLGLSNMSVTVSPSSAAFMVTTSSFPAHLRILAKLLRLKPAQQQRQQ